MIEISTKPENIWNKEKKKHISIHSVTIQFIKSKKKLKKKKKKTSWKLF